jgi:hypothetical protein
MADERYDAIVTGISRGGRFLPVELAWAGRPPTPMLGSTGRVSAQGGNDAAVFKPAEPGRADMGAAGS